MSCRNICKFPFHFLRFYFAFVFRRSSGDIHTHNLHWLCFWKFFWIQHFIKQFSLHSDATLLSYFVQNCIIIKFNFICCMGDYTWSVYNSRKFGCNFIFLHNGLRMVGEKLYNLCELREVWWRWNIQNYNEMYTIIIIKYSFNIVWSPIHHCVRIISFFMRAMCFCSRCYCHSSFIFITFYIVLGKFEFEVGMETEEGVMTVSRCHVSKWIIEGFVKYFHNEVN